jgi:hypothetical protein
MVNAFYADPAVGGSGAHYSDGDDPLTGMGDDGHALRFIPACGEVVAIGGFILGKAEEVAAAAASALGAPGTNSTSITSLAIGTGDKTFVTQTNKLWSTSQTMVAGSAANAANYMVGLCKSYDPATGILVITVATVGGSGTFADWKISLTATGGVPITRSITGGGLVTGGGDFAANRVLTVTPATASNVRAGTSNAVAVTPLGIIDGARPLVLPDNGVTWTWDMAIQPAAEGTLTGGNRALATPTGMKKGQVYPLAVTQGDSGGRQLTLPGAVSVGRAGTPSWSVGAGKIDCLYLHCLDDTAGAPKFRLGFNGDE